MGAGKDLLREDSLARELRDEQKPERPLLKKPRIPLVQEEKVPCDQIGPMTCPRAFSKLAVRPSMHLRKF